MVPQKGGRGWKAEAPPVAGGVPLACLEAYADHFTARTPTEAAHVKAKPVRTPARRCRAALVGVHRPSLRARPR